MDAAPSVTRRKRGATRGFLFADLRGYTAFLERRGAEAAAVLLERYRRLVRAVVADHDGVEIRTEGDSFYVVCPDASAAVECGLGVLEAAAEATQTDPEVPIRVGIGVHAGETIETDEGFVGSAVNLAARLCAAAGPGELLVSETVRSLTAGVSPVRYEPRGRRRFKGIADPVAVYRAVRAGADPQRSGAWSRRVMMAGSLAVAAIGALLILVLISGRGTSVDTGPTAYSPIGIASPTAALDAPASPPVAEPVAGDGSPAGPFPNLYEERLLALVPERHQPSCRRTTEADVPKYQEASIDGIGRPTWSPVQVTAGVICSPFGSERPGELAFWLVSPRWGHGALEVLYNLSGAARATPGPCGESPAAAEDWSAGPIGGRRLCVSSPDGQAMLYWTYDGTQILGRATRGDGDMESLLRWWHEEARIRRP